MGGGQFTILHWYRHWIRFTDVGINVDCSNVMLHHAKSPSSIILAAGIYVFRSGTMKTFGF